MSLDVLLVEGWFGGSHEAWATGWSAHSRHDVEIISQPGSHWQHRMDAAAVPLSMATARHVERHGAPEVVVATDMVDLASYLGLCRSVVAGGLTDAATVMYLHENQFTQPASPNGVGGSRGRHLVWNNWRSLVAADHVWSNSQWQLDSMFESLGDSLAGAPDASEQLPMLESVRDRCSVQPVGCDLTDLLAQHTPDGSGGDTESSATGDVPLVLWNHRWSHDKGLEDAVRSLRTLADEGVGFEVAVVGEDDHHDPSRGDRLLGSIADRIVSRGWLAPTAYRRLLTRADVVVACPLQENFGISVVEAVAAGCVPVVPDRLAFPETIDEPALRYPSGRLTTRLREVLVDLDRYRVLAEGCRRRLDRFDWPAVAAAYDSAIDEMA